MSSTDYEDALHAVEQLTPAERQRLVDALIADDQGNTPPADLSTILLNLPELHPATVDAMERAIEEDCDRIDPFTSREPGR